MTTAAASSGDLPAARTTVEFDIHSIARTLLWLRVADYCLLLVGAPYLISQFYFLVAGFLPELAGAQHAVGDPLDHLLQGLLVLLLLAAVGLGFHSFGNISNRTATAYLLIAPPVILCLSFLLTGLVLLKIQQPAQVGWMDLLYPLAIVAGASCGLGAAIALHVVRLKPGGLRFRDFLRSLAKPQNIVTAKAPVINRRRGLLLGFFGVVLVLVPVTLLALIGVLLLMRARQYFQIQADELLKLDQRKPVLLLRSFEDEADERKVRLNSWWNPIWMGYLLDYSIETRIGGYFRGFGPFIAIGSPQDAVPQIGAARIKLADELWQDAVIKWMDESRLIVMFAGHTHWLSWELSKVVAGRHAEKLLLIFRKAPSLGGPFDDSAKRLQAAKDAFRDTEWATTLGGIEQSATLCALAFHPGGSITAVRCPLNTYDTYHLGVLVAHRQMLEAQEAAARGDLGGDLRSDLRGDPGPRRAIGERG